MRWSHGAIELRKTELLWARLDTHYQKQKCATWARLARFLRRLPGRPSPESCTADDVVSFLISGDANGKTVVHEPTCPRPASQAGGCGCPRRLAFKSVDSMIGRLRSAFHDLGRSADNPAAARSVKMYLRDVTGEQLRAGIVPKQAVPMFSHKLRLVSLALLRALRKAPYSNVGLRFVLLRTRAALILAHASLKRGGELGQTMSSSVLRLPDNSGMLFNFVWGKTLRSGGKHVFGVLRNKEDAIMCPVSAVEAYVREARDMGVDLAGHGRYLFPPWRQNGGGVQNVPLSSSQLNTDLRYWLTRCGVYAGETIHGFRSGGAIELSLSGRELSEVMRQAGWTSASMAKYYVKEWQVMCASVAGATPPRLATAVEYERMNNMVGFCRAFV